MIVKINLTIITKNHAADPEGFWQNRFQRQMAAQQPTAWELIFFRHSLKPEVSELIAKRFFLNESMLTIMKFDFYLEPEISHKTRGYPLGV